MYDFDNFIRRIQGFDDYRFFNEVRKESAWLIKVLNKAKPGMMAQIKRYDNELADLERQFKPDAGSVSS